MSILGTMKGLGLGPSKDSLVDAVSNQYMQYMQAQMAGSLGQAQMAGPLGQAQMPSPAKPNYTEKPDGDCVTLFTLTVDGSMNMSVAPVHLPVGGVEEAPSNRCIPTRLFRTQEDAEQARRTILREALNRKVMDSLQQLTSAAVQQGLCDPVDLALLDALNAYAETIKS